MKDLVNESIIETNLYLMILVAINLSLLMLMIVFVWGNKIIFDNFNCSDKYIHY